MLLNLILVWGIVLRILVFLRLSPFNNDDHFAVARYIFANGRLPLSNMFFQAHHPALYHSLAALWLNAGGAKTVQFFSLLLSIANFALIYIFIRRTRLIQSSHTKSIMLSFAAFLPQFVLFGNFISNDALAFPIGTLIALALFRAVESLKTRDAFMAGVLGGLGLLTKMTFLPYAFAGAAVLFFAHIRERFALRRGALQALLFMSIMMVTGSYKFAENYRHFNKPLVNNFDTFPLVMKNQTIERTRLGALTDFNFPKLIRHPVWSEETRQSIPLVFYGSFWSYYICSESNFQTAFKKHADWIASTIYILGFLPTVLIAFGAWLALRGFYDPDASFQPSAACLLLVSNVALVIAFGLIYFVTACMQGRYLFQSMLPMVLLLGIGYERASAWPGMKKFLPAIFIALVSMIHFYFGMELLFPLIIPSS